MLRKKEKASYNGGGGAYSYIAVTAVHFSFHSFIIDAKASERWKRKKNKKIKLPYFVSRAFFLSCTTIPLPLSLPIFNFCSTLIGFFYLFIFFVVFFHCGTINH